MNLNFCFLILRFRSVNFQRASVQYPESRLSETGFKKSDFDNLCDPP